MPQEAVTVFTELTNIFLSMGYFPNKFKHANIKLIPKPNKPNINPMSYKPISLLEILGKINEKIFRKIITTFSRGKQYSQHEFRTSRSIGTAIAITTGKNSTNPIKEATMLVILRDVVKALENVWHNGLDLEYKTITKGLPDIIS